MIGLSNVDMGFRFMLKRGCIMEWNERTIATSHKNESSG